ncbi:MAG: agmatine deiminase family protein, partial [Acidobacteria bacterium]|nr:agmatine deiminase family protein [Acidobacteriota bacterium]
MPSATPKATSAGSTPAALGFSMPAEWERHEATWLGWPHNRSDWPGKFGAIPWVYCEIVRHLVRGERVRILVNDRGHERAAREALRLSHVGLANVEFFRFPTNRGWTRDFGPIFVRRSRPREVAIARFRFNGWAKYPDWRKDGRIPDRVARRLGFRAFPARVNGREFVLEGGAIDVNDRGSLLTTEECLLDPRTQARNPGLSRKEVEGVLCASLGARNILWLGRGIAGDDTHGHVDD